MIRDISRKMIYVYLPTYHNLRNFHNQKLSQIIFHIINFQTVQVCTKFFTDEYLPHMRKCRTMVMYTSYTYHFILSTNLLYIEKLITIPARITN